MAAKDIWVISDTHFNHANVIKFKDKNDKRIRPFNSILEMNELMIENWNKVVKPVDKVYHLGDVFFGSKGWFTANWPRLNGSKRLVVGNHDDVKYLSSGGFFQKVMMWRKFPEFGLLLTHVPVHESTLKESRFKEKQTVNVHGHIHDKPSPKGPYRCVCVEQIDYTPVNIEELRIKI